MKTIFDAIEAGDAGAVEKLIDNDKQVLATKNPAGYVPLFFAAMKGNEKIINLLLDRGAARCGGAGTR
jgi:ankyrin repeat protein